MTAEPDARRGPGPAARALGLAVNAAVARFPLVLDPGNFQDATMPLAFTPFIPPRPCVQRVSRGSRA